MEEKFEKKIGNLTPEQIQLLIKAAQNRKGDKVIIDKMPRNAEETYPLSKTQERLWFLSSLSEGEPVYNNPVVISMKVGFDLDINAMKKAVNKVAQRHEILRTTFHLIDGKIMQRIHSSCDVPVSLEDLRILERNEREEYMLEKARLHGNSVFDLEKLPLIQVHFLRIADDEYVLLINAHHIINDGWTNAMFAVEIPQLYDAEMNNRATTLPAVTRQYIDYVQTEIDWLKTEDFSKRLNFWKNQFKDIPVSPINFTDYQLQTKGYKGAKVAATFDEKQKDALYAFCRKMKITPFEFVIMAYAIVISRYSGCLDLVIGTPVANRGDGKFQHTFGPFINTLPIRFRLTAGQSFNDLVASMSPVIQQALSNQAVPFAALVEELNPERDVQSNSLFQLHFAFQSFPQLQNTNIRFVNVDYEVSKFDLNLWVEDDMEKWLLSFTYRVDSFKEETVKRLMARLTRFMPLIMANPEKPLSLIEFLEADEKSILISHDIIPASAEDLFPYVFEKTGLLYANKLALTDENASLTYHQLNQEANELAFYLNEKGIKYGDLVGVCLGRSNQMIISMLALFKIGAAYLPLDLYTPEQRLSFIIADSGIKFMIADDSLFENLSPKIEWINPNKLSKDYSHHSFPQVKIKPDDLAYVIYTSGTTGNPKGVRIGHGALYNYTTAVWHKMKLAAGDKLANVSSLAADLGNTMIFPALAYGAELLIVPENAVTDADIMSDFFNKHQPDALKIVPSHLLALLEIGNANSILPNKLLMLGGESCQPLFIKKIKALKPTLRIINHYGPTEATIGSLTYEITGELNENEPIPIGKPLANTSVYLLDAQQQIVPTGARGEIYLAGANLALGYLKRPEIESTSFVINPFLPDQKLYRTGDYGRMADGNIFFLGRKDRQVKIRGHRIELNEVEFVLRNCKGVKQVIVLAPLPSDKDQVLTAVLSIEDSNLTLNLIREEAAKTLKSPVLPDKFLVLDQLPVTANGKIDEAKIRLLATSQSDYYTATLNPRDEIELKLLNIWKKVLQLDDIGIEENFFEIGGHSLLAIKLLALISDAFGIKLPLSILFEHKNVKELAKILRADKVVEKENAIVELQKGSLKSRLYLIHPAGGNVMSYYPLAKKLKENWNVYGIQSILSGLSIPKLASFYLDKIIDDIADIPVVFAGWSMGALIAQSMCIEYKKRTGIEAGLVIIDQPAPALEIAETKIPIESAERLAVFAEKVGQLVGADLEISKETINLLNTHQQSALFFEKFKKHGLVPEDIKQEDFHGFLDLMIHHNEITMDYRGAIYYGPSLIIRAENRLQLQSTKQQTQLVDEDLGWNKWLPSNEIIEVPGNHVTIINTYVQELAEAILLWQEKYKSIPLPA